MIPNHSEFIGAIQEKRKVRIKFYSQADSGVLDRVCAPLEYGSRGRDDGLNHYWLWDYAGEVNARTLGLLPPQILELHVLGEGFDPGEFSNAPAPAPTGV